MPIYEYNCPSCRKRFRKLVGMTANPTPLQCPNCESVEVNRLISRFSRVRSEDDTLDALGEEMEAASEGDDPKALRRLMKDMGREMGEDLDDEFDEMMEEDSAELSPD